MKIQDTPEFADMRPVMEEAFNRYVDVLKASGALVYDEAIDLLHSSIQLREAFIKEVLSQYTELEPDTVVYLEIWLRQPTILSDIQWENLEANRKAVADGKRPEHYNLPLSELYGPYDPQKYDEEQMIKMEEETRKKKEAAEAEGAD